MVTPDFIEKLRQMLQMSGVPKADVAYGDARNADFIFAWTISRLSCSRERVD